MKKTLLILLTTILFVACNNQVEETPQPYNGTWYRSFETFAFDNFTFNHTYNEETPPFELRGNIVIVDEDTISLEYKEVKMSTGVWGTISGGDNIDKTFDWIIAGDIITLTNTGDSVVKDYTKQ